MIRADDRLFLTGATGEGKSTVAREIFLSGPGPRLILDPADSDLTMVPGAVAPPKELYDQLRRDLPAAQLQKAVTRALEAVAAADTIRYVPAQPDRALEYDAVYRWAFHRFPRRVWLDEAYLAAPAQGCPRWITAYLVQGRKRGLGHQACHTRPREVSKNLIAQSQHVLMWQLPNPDDRDYVAKIIGVLPDVLTGLLDQLPQYAFLHYDQREKTLDICPGLESAR